MKDLLRFSGSVKGVNRTIEFDNVSESTCNLIEKISRLAGFEMEVSAEMKKPVFIKRDGQNSMTLRRSGASIDQKNNITEFCPRGERSPKEFQCSMFPCQSPNCHKSGFCSTENGNLK